VKYGDIMGIEIRRLSVTFTKAPPSTFIPITFTQGQRPKANPQMNTWYCPTLTPRPTQTRTKAHMTVTDLLQVLQQVPNAVEVIVKGRKETVIGCSIPDTDPIPAGWARVNELVVQQIEGYKRIKWSK
jgi:hypothetical protein